MNRMLGNIDVSEYWKFEDYEIEALYDASDAAGCYLENMGFKNFDDMTSEEWMNFLAIVIRQYMTRAVPF